jgi:hypothetical protein
MTLRAEQEKLVLSESKPLDRSQEELGISLTATCT